jgi:glutamate synthase domain-containing protein 3
VVLGSAGKNFGAGMSNGVAYVLDDDGLLSRHCNTEMVEVSDLNSDDEQVLLELIRVHVERTGSIRGSTILDNWELHRERFRRVGIPREAPAAVDAAAPEAPAAESDAGAVARS